MAEAKLGALGTDKDVEGALEYLKTAQTTPHQSTNPEDVAEKVSLLLQKASEL